MYTLLKILFTLAIVVPVALVLALLGGVLLAVIVGVTGAVVGVGLLFLKAVLFVALPVLLAVWLFTRVFGHCHRDRDSREWV
ncbi:MAG TPA: hypothetical protein VIQ74_00915 [Gemmatimonadaceae bacterium]|jgi:hypothetical protein